MLRISEWETNLYTAANRRIGQRTGNRSVREAVAVLCLGVALVCPAAKAFSQEENEILQRAREAALAARTGLQTGSATGVFKKYDADEVLSYHVRFSGVFDGDKEYFHLEFLPAHEGDTPRDSKRIIVRDGSDTFVSRFSTHLVKVGAVGTIYPDASLAAASGTIAHSIKEVVRGVFPLGGIEKYDVRIEKLPNGHYAGAYVVPPQNRMTFEVAPEKGYNAVSCTVFGGPQGEQNGQKFFADWTKQDGRWFANHFVEELHVAGKLRRRNEIELVEFKPNVPVSPKLFTLSALELPDGARILDHRRAGKIPVYHKLGDKDRTAEAQSERIIEQIEAMPKMYERHEPTKVRGWRISGVIVGLLGLAAIVVIWFVRQRRGA